MDNNEKTMLGEKVNFIKLAAFDWGFVSGISKFSSSNSSLITLDKLNCESEDKDSSSSFGDKFGISIWGKNGEKSFL